jgi:hypothetical protein
MVKYNRHSIKFTEDEYTISGKCEMCYLIVERWKTFISKSSFVINEIKDEIELEMHEVSCMFIGE